MDSVVASEAIDPGSTPGARTSLRQGYGWQASPEVARISPAETMLMRAGEGCRPKLQRRTAQTRAACNLVLRQGYGWQASSEAARISPAETMLKRGSEGGPILASA